MKKSDGDGTRGTGRLTDPYALTFAVFVAFLLVSSIAAVNQVIGYSASSAPIATANE